jgi:hypothetical protein
MAPRQLSLFEQPFSLPWVDEVFWHPYSTIHGVLFAVVDPCAVREISSHMVMHIWLNEPFFRLKWLLPEKRSELAYQADYSIIQDPLAWKYDQEEKYYFEVGETYINQHGHRPRHRIDSLDDCPIMAKLVRDFIAHVKGWWSALPENEQEEQVKAWGTRVMRWKAATSAANVRAGVKRPGSILTPRANFMVGGRSNDGVNVDPGGE